MARELDGAPGTALLAAIRGEPSTESKPVILVEGNDAEPLPAGGPAADRTVKRSREFPDQLRAAVAELLADRVPAS